MLTKAAEEIFGETECFSLPVADGGEGTLEAVVSATGGGFVEAWARDPMGNPRRTHYGVTGDGRAIIEMAAASGLPLVPPELRDPLRTTSFGTGELIRDALHIGGNGKRQLLRLDHTGTRDKTKHDPFCPFFRF